MVLITPNSIMAKTEALSDPLVVVHVWLAVVHKIDLIVAIFIMALGFLYLHATLFLTPRISAVLVNRWCDERVWKNASSLLHSDWNLRGHRRIFATSRLAISSQFLEWNWA